MGSTDVFTWELQCPFDHHIEKDTQLYEAKPIGPGLWTTKVDHRTTELGVIAKTDSVFFDLHVTSADPLVGISSCDINEIPIEINN